MLHFQYGMALSKEKPIVELKHDSFAVFYSHLGNELCRKKAFQICLDKNINPETRIKLWKKHKKNCLSDGSYELILADMYIANGNPNKAINILRQSIKKDNNYDNRYHKLALYDMYRFFGEEDKAVNLANEMIAEYKNWYGGYQALGDYNLDMKNYCNSKKNLEIALKLHDKDPETYLLLAAVSYELKEDDKVIDYYWKAFKLDPIRPFADWRSSAAIVGVHVLRKEFDEAKNILDLQEEFFPEIKNSKKFQVVKAYYEKALEKVKKSNN